MASPKKASIYTDRQFELAPSLFIPLRIYQELRRGYRATVGKKHLIFRLPHGLMPTQQQEIMDQLSDWARTTFRKQPAAFSHLIPSAIPTAASLTIMDTDYRINIQENPNRESHFATILDTNSPEIRIELAPNLDPHSKSKAVQTLISRLSSNKYLPTITSRVHELNELHFQQKINSVKLRLTQSRWGSCSSTGNINLSSRLLLAPGPVRDSVIIHELAHRIEMNHSNRFWKLVYDAMPDYEEHHNYLIKFGKKLNFIPT